jgi:hypothetical protein
MADIYNVLVKDKLRLRSDDELNEYSNICTDAARAITSALLLIGNLSLEASQSEDYSDSEARRDLFLMGDALRHLPRMAQALEYNSELAAYELRRRKEAGQ